MCSPSVGPSDDAVTEQKRLTSVRHDASDAPKVADAHRLRLTDVVRIVKKVDVVSESVICVSTVLGLECSCRQLTLALCIEPSSTALVH